jgi:hypothetical protein
MLWFVFDQDSLVHKPLGHTGELDWIVGVVKLHSKLFPFVIFRTCSLLYTAPRAVALVTGLRTVNGLPRVHKSHPSELGGAPL